MQLAWHPLAKLAFYNRSSVPDSVKFHCKEIDIHLTILYLMVSFNQQDIQDAELSEFLFDLVVRLKEHFTKTFPLKKVYIHFACHAMDTVLTLCGLLLYS